MSILSFLTAPKTLDKATDAIINGADVLKLTKEEAVQYQLKATELHIELQKQIANESTPTAISRRIFGLMFVVPFVFLTLGSAILEGLSPTTAEHWLKLAQTYENPAIAVAVFYFGGHIAKSLNK